MSKSYTPGLKVLKYSDVTKDLYGKGVIFINGEEFPFVEVTIE